MVTTTPVQVNSTFQTTLSQAAQRLIAGTAVTSSPKAGWAILSKSDLLARLVAHGWIDNMFDTQRRRGPRPTARLTF